MAWTADTFQARFPEFDGTPDETVAAVLAEATRRSNPAVFGDRLDDAVGLLAAHLLSVGAYGQQARLEAGAAAETTYLAEWKRLAREAGGGPHLVGGTAGLAPPPAGYYGWWPWWL